MPGEILSSHSNTSYALKEKKLQVLPGEVERLQMEQGTVRVGGYRGEISDSHDSREMVQNDKGLIQVIKDVAQILPYCILNLTEGRQDNAFNKPTPGPSSLLQGHNPYSAVTPTGPMDDHTTDTHCPQDQQDRAAHGSEEERSED